jgi:heat shock protein HslJ
MTIDRPISFALTAIVLAAACRSAAPSRPSAAPPEVAGTSWTVSEIEGTPTLTVAPPRVEFTTDAAAGSTGCNSFRAPVERRDGSLRFGATAVTRRACAPAIMEQETRFLSALAAVQSYRRDGAMLLLEGAGGRALLRLIEASAAVPRG